MDLDEIRFHLTGPLASVKLPFTKDSEVDYDGLRNFIDASIIGGSRSIILTAGDSHFQCLTVVSSKFQYWNHKVNRH